MTAEQQADEMVNAVVGDDCHTLVADIFKSFIGGPMKQAFLAGHEAGYREAARMSFGEVQQATRFALGSAIFEQMRLQGASLEYASQMRDFVRSWQG